MHSLPAKEILPPPAGLDEFGGLPGLRADVGHLGGLVPVEIDIAAAHGVLVRRSAYDRVSVAFHVSDVVKACLVEPLVRCL